MSIGNFWQRLSRHLPWVREHERIVSATERAIAESETSRRDVAMKLSQLRPENQQAKPS
jgi:hypothetical protein